MRLAAAPSDMIRRSFSAILLSSVVQIDRESCPRPRDVNLIRVQTMPQQKQCTGVHTACLTAVPTSGRPCPLPGAPVPAQRPMGLSVECGFRGMFDSSLLDLKLIVTFGKLRQARGRRPEGFASEALRA